MKRYILITGILTVCAWLLNSCQEDLGAGTDNDKGVLTIQLNSMAATRADGPIAGIEDLNENLLKQADVFFFDENGGSQLYYEEKVSVENNTLLLMLPAEVEGKKASLRTMAVSARQMWKESPGRNCKSYRLLLLSKIMIRRRSNL